jgi:hypothetical protein
LKNKIKRVKKANEMERLRLIKLIGDLLTELDILRGSMMPNEENRVKLDVIRDDLDTRQRALSNNLFSDNTSKYLEATKELKSINDNIKQTLKEVEKVETTIKDLNKFISVVDKIISIVL